MGAGEIIKLIVEYGIFPAIDTESPAIIPDTAGTQRFFPVKLPLSLSTDI